MASSGRTLALHQRVYQWLLVLYPPGFRRDYGPAMVQLLGDQLRHPRRPERTIGARVWLRTLDDLLTSVPKQRWEAFMEETSTVSRAVFVTAVLAIVTAVGTGLAVLTGGIGPAIPLAIGFAVVLLIYRRQLRVLVTRRDVSFAGRHYRFERVSIEPLLPRFPELWVGGGSKIQTGLSPDKPYIAPAVLARIARADGWLARAAGSQQMVKDDVQAIRAYLQQIGRDPDTLRYGHLNFAHLVNTTDREEALKLQRPAFERVMGTHRSFEHLQQSYFLGTTREIVERIRDLEAAGIQDMILATCDDDLEQLERFASEIVSVVSSS